MVAARMGAQERSLIYGDASPMREVERTCRRLGRSDATLLLTGETGTGKEVLARLAHASSARSGGPFVPVNCGAIPEALVESELFGYVRGAFTGAQASRHGRVAAAEGGTLFLDEIGELPLSMQVKLLRLLQERTYEPVGSPLSQTADFRLIAATNRDLAAEVTAGRFRRDLYYRLVVCPIELPPLRARADDAVVLFEHFWRERGETRPLTGPAREALRRFSWPGNVRELQNLVERVSLCCERDEITEQDLFALAPCPAVPRAAAPLAAVEPPPEASFEPAAQGPDGELLAASEALDLRLPIDLPELLRDMEERYIDMALSRSSGNKKLAADMLGLQRTTLVEKLRRKAKLAAAS